MVTVAQMSAWNKVAQIASSRKLEHARMEAVAKILAERKAKAEKVKAA